MPEATEIIPQAHQWNAEQLKQYLTGRLSWESSQLWIKLVPARITDPAQLILLGQALAARERAEDARKIIDQQGQTAPTPAGGQAAHPLLSVEAEARVQFLRAWQSLGLDKAAP